MHMPRHKRTNIVLDMDKVDRIKKRTGLTTTTAVVDFALDSADIQPMSWEEIRALEGGHSLWDDFEPRKRTLPVDP